MTTKTLLQNTLSRNNRKKGFDVKTFYFDAGTQSRDERHCDHSLHGICLWY